MKKNQNPNIVDVTELFQLDRHYGYGVYLELYLNSQDCTFPIVRSFLQKKIVRSDQKSPAAYFIINRLTGDFYIGSTKNIKNRLNRHICLLVNRKHYLVKLQNTFHSPDVAFLDVCIILTPTREIAYDVEQLLLDRCFGNGCCLNRQPTARSSLGITHSVEYKKKMSRILSAVPRSENWGYNVSRAKKTEANLAHCYRNSMKLAKRVIVSGIEYPSISECARCLGVTNGSVIYRLKSNREQHRDDRYI